MQQESILIVDDETLNLQVLRQLLMPQFRIKACKSDKAAFRIRSDAPLPGLILLHSRMHEMDGEKTHAAIKQNQAFKEVRC